MPTDFVVAEVVVDLRTYRPGYEVQVASKAETDGKSSKPIQLSTISDEFVSEKILPIACAVYALPPSPLYTSSSSVETPVRHLLRLTLPTSQFEVPAVEDPLTGEVHSAPPKPQWYRDLEASDKRCLVRIQINPLLHEKEKKGKAVVYVDGTEVSVGGEKDILRSLATEEASMDVLSRYVVSSVHCCGNDTYYWRS